MGCIHQDPLYKLKPCTCRQERKLDTHTRDLHETHVYTRLCTDMYMHMYMCTYMCTYMYMDVLALYTQTVHGTIHEAAHVQRPCSSLYSGL